jgi:hypothetical protein
MVDWEPLSADQIIKNIEAEVNRVCDIPMNYNKLHKIKRPMNVFEKLSVGWTQVLDTRWEWWYHLTEAEPEMYFEFWMMLNQDMVEFTEEHYYLK